MKLIIAGSRTIQVSTQEIFDLITEFGLHPSQIVSGTANGVDKCGEAFARKVYLPVKQFPANWDMYGKSAGHHRNEEMGRYADALLLIWDGESRGSKSMKTIMENLDKPVYEAVLKSNKV